MVWTGLTRFPAFSPYLRIFNKSSRQNEIFSGPGPKDSQGFAVIRRHPPRNTSSGAPLASLRDAGLPRLTCVCHRLPANRVRSPHSARRAPLPSRFLITLRFSFCFSNFILGSFFFSQLPSGVHIVSPNRIDAVSRRQYVRRGGPRTLTLGSVRERRRR